MIRRVSMLAAALVVAGLAPGVALAQREPRPITLDEAVAMASENAPRVIQAQGQSRTSSASVRAAYASFLPNLSISAGATRQVPSGARTRVENGQVITLPSEPWSSNIGLGANVELFDGGRRFFDLRQAKARELSAGANEVTQRFNASLDVKQQFFNVLAARESQAAAAAQLEQADQQRVVAIARTRAKAATRSDSLRAEIQLRNAQLAVLDAKNALEAANASLARAVGSTEPVTAAPMDSLAGTTLSIDEAEIRRLAADGPAVRQSVSDLTAAKAASRASWTDYLPSVTASYSRSGSGTGNGLVSDDLEYAGSVRLSLSLPLFNQLQREAQVVSADVARDNAEATLRDARLAAVENVTRMLGDYRSASERVSSQTATVDAALEDLRVQQQRYAVGGSTLLDVLTSQTQLDQARRDLIRARYDLRVAKAQLETLVGRNL